MAGRSASSTITRYAGIQVQTSALGLNVPVGWGTFRCKCNLVDYLDFKSKATKAAASKGGTTTGYTYSATVILALCEGPIDSVSTIYVDGKVYKNGAKTALAQANLNLHAGAIGQPVWSYLTSNHASHAIGYSGLAIAYQSNYALDSSAQTPNHSFEVVRTAGFGVAGAPDADPSLVVTDFFTNSRYGVPSWTGGLLGDLTQYQDYCLAAGLLVSPVIDSQRSASDFLTELLKATNSTCVWSEGMLKFIPYGDTALSGNGKTYAPNNTPVYSLNDDDYIPQTAGDDPLTIDIQDQSDAYNVVQLEYLDRTNEYNMAIALASDAANVAQYGMRRKDPDTVHCIATPTVAALSAQLYLQRTLYIRSQFRFTLGWQFALLEPGDILELTDTALGLNACPVRIIQIDDDEDACRAIIAEDYPIGVSHAPLYTMQTGAAVSRDTNIDPGGVEANLLLWSDDPTKAVWAKSALSVTGAAANDQYGLPTAALLVPTSTNAEHYLLQSVTEVFAGVSYTYSVCLQKNAHYRAAVQMTDGVSSGATVYVDLNAGAITSAATAFGTNCAVVGCAMAPTLVSGVWQINLTCQFPTLPGAGVNVAVILLDDAGDAVWTGDGLNHCNISQQALRQGVAAGVYAATGANLAGPVIFNPPSVLNSGDSSIFAAVAGGPNWGGANVWVSIDGTDFQEIGTVDAPARFGRLTAGYPAHSDPDGTDTLSVDLGESGGQLTGASATSAANGATTCWIGGELIAFTTANLTHPSRYDLVASASLPIRRGFMSTPIASHAAGDLFVRMDDAIFDFPYLDVNTGQTIYVKFQSFNLYGQGLVPLDQCVSYSIVPNPVAANAPAAAAWSVAAATISNAGAAMPVLAVTGAVDNPSADAVSFFYRQHGLTPWISAGAHAVSTTAYDIASIVSGAAYDVGVAYDVGGVGTAITQIGTNVGVGLAVAPGIVGQGTGATTNVGALAVLSSVDLTTGQVTNKSLANLDSAASTKLGGVAAGATKNVTTYSATAPSSPSDGDIWVDTGVTPNITYLHAGGAWQVAANYVLNTNELADGANLGGTATWTGVSSVPGNVATLASSGVTTGLIAPNAVTNPVNAFTSGAAAFSTGGETTIQTVSLTTAGGIVKITGAFIASGATSVVDVTVGRIYRDGTLIYQQNVAQTMPDGAGGFEWAQTPAVLLVHDSPSAGAHTYSMTAETNNSNGTALARFLDAFEVKR